MEWVEFTTKKIPEGNFHLFIYIVSYLHFFTGDMVSTAELQSDDVHASKVRKKEQSIDISAFKTYVPQILGGFH